MDEFENYLDNLTPEQLAEVEQKYETETSPIKFVKWLIQKVKEWLKQA